jgi:hypothetical protein
VPPVLFNYQRPLSNLLTEAKEKIKAAVRAEPDSYVRDADAEQWAAHLAEKFALDPPVLIEEGIEVQDFGEVDVDATGMPGVSYSISEWGQQIIRPGRGFRLVMPVAGRADLLEYGPSAGAAIVEAAIEGGVIYRRWEWPIDRGTQALDDEIKHVMAQVREGAKRVAAEVVQYNGGLAAFATQVIAEGRAELGRHSDFLSGLTVPVRPREDAPKQFSLPEIERRKPRSPLAPKPEPVSGPELGKFYAEILDVVRSRGRGMERTPAGFADREEEHLRDDLLVSLNQAYLGQAGAEMFNLSGKTDLLLRVQDHNAFIAECKWWSGVKDMGKALDQLYGYSTWRDSRLALIFFVGAKDPVAIVEKARQELGSRPEFAGWEAHPQKGELRCRVKWPDDPARTATLTVLFFHLPRG